MPLNLLLLLLFCILCLWFVYCDCILTHQLMVKSVPQLEHLGDSPQSPSFPSSVQLMISRRMIALVIHNLIYYGRNSNKCAKESTFAFSNQLNDDNK